ncbi:MAG: hypothetical protein AB8C02_09315 [Halioglobus sp.]
MPTDDLDNIPSIVPSREGAPGRKAAGKSANRGQGASRQGSAPAARAGAGWLARFFITVALVVAAVACAWAWQLQNELREADQRASGYAARIADLEARLSDTDEGMNQNAAVQAVKISELESEVRKLWDNVWKKTKSRLTALESASKTQQGSIKSSQGTLTQVEKELAAATAEVDKLKSVAGDMSRLIASAKTNQAEVERVADALNRINLQLNKLDKRVQGNEEWVGSINAFRKQVNASLSELQASVQQIRSTP